jgi:DNA repair exonuclease SbcCD ATPase subunit
MARSKPISVKIATQKVISALETRLAQLQADYTKQDENEAKYQKKVEAWKKEIGEWAIANFSKAENLRTNYRNWNNNLNVDFDIVVKEGDFPAEPVKDFEIIHQHTYREMKDEMENAIRILKMTDEETVSASTYNAIARYL